jgi:hypothetical protein
VLEPLPLQPDVSNGSGGVNDKEFEHQKQRLLVLIQRWVGPLGLGWWDIVFDYERGSFDVDGELAPESAAKCRANWRYGHAHITFNMPCIAEQSDDQLERILVHEFMHIFLHETRENDDDWLDHEERVASTLTKAFLWLRESLTTTTL